MTPSTLSYRAEIDGLRAIAVVSVILYHTKLVLFGREWFEGGYIGVDIFFVISGYLITRIILSELYEKNSFSFLNFYERRARRILPMLFLVIFVSIPIAWQKLLPSDFVEYAESIFASLLFGSNFFFYFSTTEYGADNALLKPLLHTWSLGVEEQFYFVFPIIAIIAFKHFRKHFLTVLVVLSLLSLQFAELMEVRNSSLNFYLPFSRFWELMVGSILAYRELNYKVEQENNWTQLLPMLGLCLVTYSVLFFDSKTPHPSFHTIIPIFGIALIVGFSSKKELVGKVLGSKPFVWIGLISYSAYLWHFPIFAFSRIGGTELSNYDRFEGILVTLLLSVISYRFVERLFRNNVMSSKLFALLASFLAAALIGLGSLSVYLFDIKNIENFSRARANAILDKGAFLEAWRDQATAEFKETNFDNSKRKKVLLVGNSHAVDFFRVLNSAKIYGNIDFGLVSQNRNTDNYQVSCFYKFLVNQDKRCGGKGIVFNDLEAKMKKAEIIILATRWLDSDFKVLKQLVHILKNDFKKSVLIVGNAFEQKEKPIAIREFIKVHQTHPKVEQLNDLRKKVFINGRHDKIDKIDAKLLEVAGDMNVPFVEKKDLFCDFSARECRLFTDEGFLILWDYGHLTVNGSRYVGSIVSSGVWGKEFLLNLELR